MTQENVGGKSRAMPCPCPHDTMLRAGLLALSARDTAIANSLKRLGPPLARKAPQGLATLVRIVAGQQVSTKAAATVFARLEQAAGRQIDCQSLLRLGVEGLRRCGLSGRKTDYVLGLAQACREDRLATEGWPDMSDAEVAAEIKALKGFGQWSADIYLIFALARPDVMPVNDLAVRAGYAKLKSLSTPPSAQDLAALTQSWSPHRSAAAHLLWQVYGAATL